MALELLAGERKENETDKAVIGCNAYLRMGPGRSLEKLCETYQSYAESRLEKPPTRHLATLKQWSASFEWVQRAQAYDGINEVAQTAEVQRLRTEGLAADYERIRELDAIYRALNNEFGGGTGIWYWDTKISAKGDTVNVKVFNKPLIDSMRGVLDDIAKEVGGRKQQAEISGPRGGPIEHTVKHDLSKLQVDELKALRQLVAKATPTDAGIANA